MDLLCGEVEAEYCRINKASLPAVLFETWRASPIPGHNEVARLGRQPSNVEEDVSSIKQHLKEGWSEVCSANAQVEPEHFAKVLRACTGVMPTEEVTEEIMR